MGAQHNPKPAYSLSLGLEKAIITTTIFYTLLSKKDMGQVMSLS